VLFKGKRKDAIATAKEESEVTSQSDEEKWRNRMIKAYKI
jgi:hypothetical protein